MFWVFSKGKIAFVLWHVHLPSTVGLRRWSLDVDLGVCEVLRSHGAQCEGPDQHSMLLTEGGRHPARAQREDLGIGFQRPFLI